MCVHSATRHNIHLVYIVRQWLVTGRCREGNLVVGTHLRSRYLNEEVIVVEKLKED